MSKTRLKTATWTSPSETDPLLIALCFPLRGSGHLFSLLDAREGKEALRPLIHCVISHLEEEAGGETHVTHPQHRFEQMVERLNDAIAYQAVEEAWEASPADVRALIGLCDKDTMYLTGAGDATGLFLHREEDGRYKIFNLFRSLHTETHKPSWQKLFSVVLDGDMHPGDVFVAANHELPQTVDQQDLLSILTSLPPSSAMERLRQIAGDDVALFIARAEEAQAKIAMEISGAASSLEHLANTKETTRRLLDSERPRQKDWSPIAKGGWHFLYALVSSSISVFLAILFGTTKQLFVGIRSLRGGRRRETTRLVLSGTRLAASSLWTHFRQAGNHFRGLPKYSRRLLWIMGGFALVFVGSLFFFSLQRQAQKDQQVVLAIMDRARDLADTASASVIYNNEEDARNKLLEGLSLLSQPTIKEKSLQAQMNALRAELEESLNRLRHIEIVSSLSQAATLPTEEQAVALGYDGKTFFAFTKTGAVYSYKSDTASFVATTSKSPDNFGPPTRVRFDDLSNLFYLFDGRQIASFDPENGTFEIVSVRGLDPTVHDIDIYARRVYTLSAAREQIFRHERDGDRFSEPTQWIQAKTISLADALSFSLDGSAWVLKQSGQIVRYQKGLEQPWKTPVIDPPISDTARLWTTDQTPLLYIVDRSSKRVIVIDKETATVKKQLSHEAFADLQGLWDVQGALWVQMANGLYQLPRS